MGGWDQGLLVASDLGDGFTIIAPSRGGYLGTPLASGQTPDEVADLIIALLDSLNIGAVGVMGVSGGGPTALAMALRHPQRVRALAMVAAISGHHEQPELTRKVWLTRILFSDLGGVVLDFPMWILFRHMVHMAPRFVIRRTFNASEAQPPKDVAERVNAVMQTPSQRQWLARLFDCCLPLSARKSGLDNDVAQFARLGVYPVQEIRCPTLVVHGRHDGNVPFSHARFVADGVPGAELFVAESCGHMIWMSDDFAAAAERLRSFFRLHLV
jgi:pimeloyl-ACP methyl ester carboxylesterase